MSTDGISAPLEQTIMIDDHYLDDHSNPDIDLETLSPANAFVEHRKMPNGESVVDIPRAQANGRFDVRAIHINKPAHVTDTQTVEVAQSNVVVETTTTTGIGVINCRYKNDPHFHKETFEAYVDHWDRLRYIKCHGTTARGIIIKM